LLADERWLLDDVSSSGVVMSFFFLFFVFERVQFIAQCVGHPFIDIYRRATQSAAGGVS
jgi:hypothetical protein